LEQERTERFPKRLRLIQSQDFVDCKARGKRRASAHLIVWFCPNERPHARLGLAVSRKVGKAHDRNRFKRRVRELFRRGLVPFRSGYDYVIVAKSSSTDVPLAELQQEMSALLSGGTNPSGMSRRSPR
jgi:ribonuclease P protein component